MVTPRLTWTPIEPILRAPEPSGEATAAGPTRVPCGPVSPDAIGGSPAVQTPVRPVEDLRRDPVSRERRDHHRLQSPDVGVDVIAVGPEVDDRVGDQLTRPVVRDAPAAVGLGDLDALHRVPVLAHRQLLIAGATALV